MPDEYAESGCGADFSRSLGPVLLLFSDKRFCGGGMCFRCLERRRAKPVLVALVSVVQSECALGRVDYL